MKRLFEWAGNLGLAVAVLFALFCLGARLFWVFELFTHYQVYWAMNALLVAALFTVAACYRRAAIAVLLAVFFGWSLVPYFLPRAAPPGATQRTARVVLFNVLVDNDRHAGVLEYLRAQGADIVVVQEFSPGWRAALQPLESIYPHRIYEVRRAPDAMAIFSKFPLGEIQWYPSQRESWPFASATVEVPGKTPLRLIAVHPPPPVGSAGAGLRNQRLRSVGYLASTPGATVVVGDLNCSPWSPHFRDLLEHGGLRDSSLGRGITPTWHLFPGLSIPIDHVLHSAEVQVLSREVGPELGSDHRAVVVDLVW